jgi:hypothetical protein
MKINDFPLILGVGLCLHSFIELFTLKWSYLSMLSERMVYIPYLTLLPSVSGLSYVDGGGGHPPHCCTLKPSLFAVVICLLDADYLWARIACLQKIGSYKKESSSIPFPFPFHFIYLFYFSHYCLFLVKLFGMSLKLYSWVQSHPRLSQWEPC